MFGYACNETRFYACYYSHKILRLMAQDRKSSILKNRTETPKSSNNGIRKWKAKKSNFCGYINAAFKDLNQEKV